MGSHSSAATARARPSGPSAGPTRSSAKRSAAPNPSVRKVSLCLVLLLLLATGSPPARAWGDEGHEIIALVAEAFLQPDVRRRVSAMLATDTDPLTAHDIAAEATWADHYRDADINGSRALTRRWHFVDIELSDPSLDQACFNHPRLPPGTLASLGPPDACVVDKISQFTAELGSPATPPDERLVALKFLLHLVGDLHQPLHAADEHDRGGNEKRVSATGFRPGTLHHYWDTEFVVLLGDDPRQVAQALVRQVPSTQARNWARGTAADWAQDSFALARDDAYGQLPPPTRRHTYRLTPRYIDAAVRDTQVQLTKAGIRLAYVLNTALSRR
ncbi:MAG: S1/P1 Nuclease [Acetobacteraceae bacterium]|nr:S1/P1 Nuclease [Acetobacteraceae bacterium]